ncbi:hypothetical protein TWF788_006066 [Orbilia oligospora]|uniref:Uncharacterized protein n=1 Tax=Orbilia oligospora TaxID=2813651 RepID=A0A7C8Q387_ORBOL|nr:hypothetical protein TWF788_006066 [Orbilia oligospora]
MEKLAAKIEKDKRGLAKLEKQVEEATKKPVIPNGRKLLLRKTVPRKRQAATNISGAATFRAIPSIALVWGGTSENAGRPTPGLGMVSSVIGVFQSQFRCDTKLYASNTRPVDNRRGESASSEWKKTQRCRTIA